MCRDVVELCSPYPKSSAGMRAEVVRCDQCGLPNALPDALGDVARCWLDATDSAYMRMRRLAAAFDVAVVGAVSAAMVTATTVATDTGGITLIGGSD